MGGGEQTPKDFFQVAEPSQQPGSIPEELPGVRRVQDLGICIPALKVPEKLPFPMGNSGSQPKLIVIPLYIYILNVVLYILKKYL